MIRLFFSSTKSVHKNLARWYIASCHRFCFTLTVLVSPCNKKSTKKRRYKRVIIFTACYSPRTYFQNVENAGALEEVMHRAQSALTFFSTHDRSSVTMAMYSRCNNLKQSHGPSYNDIAVKNKSSLCSTTVPSSPLQLRLDLIYYSSCAHFLSLGT